MVEDVPQPCYDNVDVTLVYPKELRGRLRPRGLYANRDGALQVYDWLLQFIETHAVPDKPVLLYAKRDFLDKLGSEEKKDANGDPIVVGGRPVHFVHFGTGRGFNEWRECETYIRLADFYMSREDAVATTGSVLNRLFTYGDLNALSSGQTKDPAVESLVRLRLLSASVQDAARSALRCLDANGRPAVPVKVFLVDPDPAVVQMLKSLWPGIRDPQIIGDPRPKASNRGNGLRALKAALAFLDERERDGKTWGTKEFQEATGTIRTNVPPLLRHRLIKDRLETHWERQCSPGKPWRYVSKDAQGVSLM